jgi:DNA-binding NtrC family response regulator
MIPVPMKPTILVLDDEPDILDEIGETLMNDGLDVLTVGTGADLWAAADCTRLMELHTLMRDTLITYRGSNDIIKTQEQNVYAAI